MPRGTRLHTPLLFAVLALLGACALLLVAAAPAGAQSSAFCQQYPNDPTCVDDITGGGDPDNDDVGADTGGGNSPIGAGNATSQLPFTGFPLTPALLLMLLLLAAGIALRTAVWLRERHASSES